MREKLRQRPPPFEGEYTVKRGSKKDPPELKKKKEHKGPKLSLWGGHVKGKGLHPPFPPLGGVSKA